MQDKIKITERKMTIAEEFFYLIRNEICGEKLPNDIDFNVKTLYVLSKRHDLAHLVSDALLKSGFFMSEEIVDKLEKERLLAVYRETQISYFKEFIAGLFNGAGVDFILLKGALIRDLYPEIWMRTSCDIDILVREKDIDKATEILVDNGFETDGKKNYHDIHLFYGDVHLELHFSIKEDVSQIDGLLSRAWEYAEKTRGNEYRITPEYFAFHHIAHMAYHFLSGGCGVRPFIDLWLLKQKCFYDEEKLLPLLKICSLIKFYDAVCELTAVWFNGKEHNEITRIMERYVLSGGVYGSGKNVLMMGVVASNGNKCKYLFKMAFPSFKTMRSLYPILNKAKILLPFCYIHRFFVKLFGKNRKKVKEKINTVSRFDKSIEETRKLLEILELHK